VDEVTVGLGLGDLSWDLVGEVHALKVNENVSHFYVFPWMIVKVFPSTSLAKGPWIIP
jgi:hypothetical protein